MSKRRELESEDLNLVPIMNLVSILIPFLLVASQFVNLAVVDSSLPAICADCELDTEEPDAVIPAVVITDQGLVVMEAGEALPVDLDRGGYFIPCPANSCADGHDYDGLTRAMGLIKDEYPDSETVRLLPEPEVPYVTLINVMDAAREESQKDGGRLLFPFQSVGSAAP